MNKDKMIIINNNNNNNDNKHIKENIICNLKYNYV